MKLNLHNQLINQVNALPTKNYYHIKNIDKTDLTLFKFAYFDKYIDEVLTINPKFMIPVPSNWQMYGFDSHQYTNHQYPFPLNPPYIDKDNPCGVYVCDYYVENFDKNHFLNIDGADSCVYVFINNKFIGYSTVSHSDVEFDITEYLALGKNEIRLIVFKWCAQSYLEDQDKFRMSGLFRDVYILRRNKDHLRTFKITSNQGITIPSNVKVNITNGTFFNSEYIFGKNNQITVSLPKNETYTISSEDFMIGNKLYRAFENHTVNTNSSVNNLTLIYETLFGKNVLLKDYTYEEFSGDIDTNDILAYIYSDDDNDYYISIETNNMEWASASVNESSMYTDVIELDGGYTTESHQDGLENTNLLNEYLKLNDSAVYKAKSSTYLSEYVKYNWYVPSVEELSNVMSNFRNALPSTQSAWWTSNIKDADTVYTLNNSGACEEVNRTETRTIIIFGKRNYDN
jgi:hypothetical protein